jgi:hypothetical protein
LNSTGTSHELISRHFPNLDALTGIVAALFALADIRVGGSLFELPRDVFSAVMLGPRPQSPPTHDLVRWQARRDLTFKAKGPFRLIRLSPIRPGPPQGWRRRHIHEVNPVLAECHGVAPDLLDAPRSSQSHPPAHGRFVLVSVSAS